MSYEEVSATGDAVAPARDPNALNDELQRVGQTLEGDQSSLRFLLGKARRHWQWVRSEGIGRLVEEDDLHPLGNVANRWAKWRWRRANPVPVGHAAPVFVVGLQRSGTNMVVRGLDRAGEFEVRNENDRGAFRRYRLRPDDEVQALVRASPARYVLLKPLCDSHRVDELLAWKDVGGAPRAIWVYRQVDARVRSALAKFGDHDRVVLQAIVAGRGEQLWQAQRLSPGTRSVLEDVGTDRLNAESASALFWWARNRLFFELGLHQRPDVELVAYEGFLTDPVLTMQHVTQFLGMAYRPALVAHVARRPTPHPQRIDLDPRVRHLCDDLQSRLDAVLTARGFGQHPSGV